MPGGAPCGATGAWPVADAERAVPRTRAAAPRENFRIAYSLRASREPLTFPLRDRVIPGLKGANNSISVNRIKRSLMGGAGSFRAVSRVSLGKCGRGFSIRQCSHHAERDDYTRPSHSLLKQVLDYP